jgi:hypothetical protein
MVRACIYLPPELWLSCLGTGRCQFDVGLLEGVNLQSSRHAICAKACSGVRAVCRMNRIVGHSYNLTMGFRWSVLLRRLRRHAPFWGMDETPAELRAELIAKGDIAQFQARVDVETDDGKISLLMSLLVHEFDPLRINNMGRDTRASGHLSGVTN